MISSHTQCAGSASEIESRTGCNADPRLVFLSAKHVNELVVIDLAPISRFARESGVSTFHTSRTFPIRFVSKPERMTLSSPSCIAKAIAKPALIAMIAMAFCQRQTWRFCFKTDRSAT